MQSLNLYELFSLLSFELHPRERKASYQNNFSLLKNFIHTIKLDYTLCFKKISNCLFKPFKRKDVPSLDEIAKIFKSLTENKRRIKNWNEKVKVLFIWEIAIFELIIQKEHFYFNDYDWNLLASFFPMEDYNDLKYIWQSMVIKNLKYEWTMNEDECLRNLFEENEGNSTINWLLFAKEIYATTGYFRTAKQCFERWKNHLDPKLKRKNWSIKEDLHLLQNYLYFKSKWSLIAKTFEGRNQHTIKNRFFSILGKESKIARRTLQKNLKNLDEYGLILKAIRSLNEALEREEDKQVKMMLREEDISNYSSNDNKTCDEDYRTDLFESDGDTAHFQHSKYTF